MKKTPYLALFIVLLLAIAIRLYPTVISGNPFSTDAWPLIRNTEILLQNSPVPLNSGIFDGYNNYWPLISLFGAVSSLVTSLPPITAMAIGIPIAAALTIPIFYLLVKKITHNNNISLIAAALLTTVFPYALFTAGVTKETLASPIYISLILVFLLKQNWKTIILFSTLSIALVLAHHLTTFLTITILASLCAAFFTIKKDPKQKINSNKTNFLLLAILSIVTAAYFLLFAGQTSFISLSSTDLLTIGAYQILILTIATYSTFLAKKHSRKITILNALVAFTAVFLFTFLLTQVPLLSIAPILPSHYLIYALPFIIAVPLIIFGLNELYQRKSSLIIPLFWSMSIIAFASYAVLADPAGSVTFASRSLNFLLPPLLILVAVGINKISSKNSHFKLSRPIKLIAVAVILVIVTVNSYSVYATVSLQEPYFGYFWRYNAPEYTASDWLSTNMINQTVAGDSKVSYLVQGYFNQSVTTTAGYRYLAENGSKPELLYVYNQMNTNGYVLSQGIPYRLPTNWTDKLEPYNLIYQNSEVTIYARR